MKDLLKNGRIEKGMTTRQVSELLRIDQALISKFENGLRMPTRKQIIQLSQFFSIDPDILLLEWLKQKIRDEISGEPLALKALKAVESELSQANPEVDAQFQKLLREMESLKTMLGKKD